MLATLNKLATGRDDFSKRELAYLAQQHFDHFAKIQRPDILERLFAYIPVKEQEDKIDRTLSALCYHSPTCPDNGVLKYLLEKAEAMGASQQFWDGLIGDSDSLIHPVTASGSLETLDYFLDCIRRHCGDAAVVSQLPYADTLTIPMIDKMLALCETHGGEALVKEFIRCSPFSVRHILDDYSNKQASADKRIAAATHLLRKQYEVGGTKPVTESMEEVLEAYEFIDESMRVDCTKAVFESLLPIGGNELVKAVLEHDDYKLTRAFAYTCDLEIADTIDDLAMKTQDQELTEKTRFQTTYAWSAGQTFSDWAEVLLNDDELEALPREERADTVEHGLNILKAEHKIEAPQDQTHDEVVKVLLGDGHREQFHRLAQVYETALDVDIWADAVGRLKGLIQTGDNAYLLADLISHSNEYLSASAIEEAVTQASDERLILKSLTGPEAFLDLSSSWSLLLRKYLKDAEAYLDACREVGGQELIDKVIAGLEGDYQGLAYCIATQRVELIEPILNRLSPEARQKAVQHVPEWVEAEQDKSVKRELFLAQSKGSARWQAVTGELPPHETLEPFSPYKFKRKLYEKILPAITFAAEHEGQPKSGPTYAYKLATLFSSEDEIDAYLKNFSGTWGAGSAHLIHDVCMFTLPERHAWSPKKWKALVKEHGPKVYPFLQVAAEVEAILGDDELPNTIQELAGLMMSLDYDRRENIPLASMARQSGLPESAFNELLDFARDNGKQQDYLPDVKIDGTLLGFSDIYMERLQPSNPLGYFLGLVSNSCQSVGHNGEACALYGMSSPYSGFYVWRSQSQVASEEDPIVAQSWVWIGEDNALVFDSFERLKPAYNEFLQPFVEQFAYQVIDQHRFEDAAGSHYISAVRLGCDPSGQTPPLALSKTKTPSQIRDYSGLYSDGTPARDSNEQYIITPINRVKQPQIKLAAAVDRSETKEIAANYIESVTDAWQREHGLSVQAAVSLQFYVAGADWIPITNSRDLKALRDYWEREGLAVAQDDQERTHGIHRLCGPWRNPMKAAAEMFVAQGLTKAFVEQQGLKQAHFTPRPYKGREWLGGSIAISLQGDLSCLADAEKLAAFSANLGAFTQQSFLAYAEKDIDYARFWNSAVAPRTIQPGPNNQHGLSFVADKSELLVENRLLSTNGNIITALAATLAGVEHALASFAHPPECQFDIPNSRQQAFAEMNKGLQRGSFNGATPLFDAIAKQHKPVPVDRPLPTVGQQTAQAKL